MKVVNAMSFWKESPAESANVTDYLLAYLGAKFLSESASARIFRRKFRWQTLQSRFLPDFFLSIVRIL